MVNQHTETDAVAARGPDHGPSNENTAISTPYRHPIVLARSLDGGLYILAIDTKQAPGMVSDWTPELTYDSVLYTHGNVRPGWNNALALVWLSESRYRSDHIPSHWPAPGWTELARSGFPKEVKKTMMTLGEAIRRVLPGYNVPGAVMFDDGLVRVSDVEISDAHTDHLLIADEPAVVAIILRVRLSVSPVNGEARLIMDEHDELIEVTTPATGS